MKTKLGLPFVIFGPLTMLTYTVAGIALLGLLIRLFNQVGGLLGVVVGLVLLPITGIVGPFYAAFKLGDWLMLIILFGGLIVAGIFAKISGWEEGRER